MTRLDAVPRTMAPTLAAALAANPRRAPRRRGHPACTALAPSVAEPLFSGFEAYDVINDRYVVLPDAVGEGGTARVYHVDDTLHGRSTRRSSSSRASRRSSTPNAEFMLLRDLPPHRCIVKPELLQTGERRSRATTSPRAASGVFMLSPWVDGTRLDHLLAARTDPARTRGRDRTRQSPSALGTSSGPRRRPPGRQAAEHHRGPRTACRDSSTSTSAATLGRLGDTQRRAPPGTRRPTCTSTAGATTPTLTRSASRSPRCSSGRHLDGSLHRVDRPAHDGP